MYESELQTAHMCLLGFMYAVCICAIPDNVLQRPIATTLLRNTQIRLCVSNICQIININQIASYNLSD